MDSPVIAKSQLFARLIVVDDVQVVYMFTKSTYLCLQIL